MTDIMDKLILEDGFRMSEGDGMKFYSCMYQEIPDAKLPSGKRLVKIADNATMLGGTQKLAQLLCGFDNTYSGITPIVTVDSQIANLATTTPKVDGKSKVFGVLFGLDGSAGTVATVYPVQRSSSGFDVAKLIPVRRVYKNDEDIDLIKAKYGLRAKVDVSGEEYFDWYLKRPTDITMKSMTKSGMIFTAGNPPINYNGNEDVVTVVSFTIDVAQEDFGEYFQIAEGDIAKRRFNSVMICYGTEVTATMKDTDNVDHTMVDYRNIIVTNKYNILPRALDKYNTGRYVINCYFR